MASLQIALDRVAVAFDQKGLTFGASGVLKLSRDFHCRSGGVPHVKSDLTRGALCLDRCGGPKAKEQQAENGHPSIRAAWK